MSFLLCKCPFCEFEWNRFQPLQELDPLTATTAVQYPLNCPRCGIGGYTYDSNERGKEALDAQL